MRYVLKIHYPSGEIRYGVIMNGCESKPDPNSSRSPDFDRRHATPLTLEQAEGWKKVLEGGSRVIEIEPI